MNGRLFVKAPYDFCGILDQLVTSWASKNSPTSNIRSTSAKRHQPMNYLYRIIATHDEGLRHYALATVTFP